MKIRLENVRLAFAAIFEPKAVNGEGEPRYSACLIMEPRYSPRMQKEDGTWAMIDWKTALGQVATDKWAAKSAAILEQLTKTDKICFKPHPKTNQTGDVYDGFENKWHLNCSNKTRPMVIDRDKSPLVQADGKPYSGCYVHATVDLWAQDNSFGKRINASLRGVQFAADGDAFAGGGTASEDEFEDLGAPTETADDLV
jgi:hypothetical protein